jgi:hypothetical protein
MLGGSQILDRGESRIVHAERSARASAVACEGEEQ